MRRRIYLEQRPITAKLETWYTVGHEATTKKPVYHQPGIYASELVSLECAVQEARYLFPKDVIVY